MDFFSSAHAVFFFALSGWVVYFENKESIIRKIAFGFSLAAYFVGWQIAGDGLSAQDFLLLAVLIFSSFAGAAIGWWLKLRRQKTLQNIIKGQKMIMPQVIR